MSYGVRRPKDNWNWVLEEEEALKHLKVRLPWPYPVLCASRTAMIAVHELLRSNYRDGQADAQFAYDNGINVSILAGLRCRYM